MDPRRVAACVALGITACAAGACSTTVNGDVVHAPLMPARMYPSVVVLHRGMGPEAEIASALAEHLAATSDSRVSVMSASEIAAAAPLPAGTVVLQLQVDSASGERLDYVPMYGTACGFYSCFGTSTAVPVRIPTVMARLTAQLRDGRTADVLVTQVADEARDASHFRGVSGALERDLVSFVDGPHERVAYTIRHVKEKRAARAIEAMRRGRFAEARPILETVLAEGRVHGWKTSQKARFFYALAIARRFDPTTMNDIERHYRAAIEACDVALRLEPHEAVRALRAQLERDRAEAHAIAGMLVEGARLRAEVEHPTSTPGTTSTTSATSTPGEPSPPAAPLPNTPSP